MDFTPNNCNAMYYDRQPVYQSVEVKVKIESYLKIDGQPVCPGVRPLSVISDEFFCFFLENIFRQLRVLLCGALSEDQSVIYSC
jgi:hypothetical protein